MEIIPTRDDFFDQLKAVYSKNVIKGKKTNEEVLELFQKNYGKLELLQDKEKYDYTVERNLERFKYILEYHNIKNYHFNIYLLEKCANTQKYYDYYSGRFVNCSNVYLFHELESDQFFSNCEPLALELEIMGGIDEYDIINNTRKYQDYLNLMYVYDECLENYIK